MRMYGWFVIGLILAAPARAQQPVPPRETPRPKPAPPVRELPFRYEPDFRLFHELPMPDLEAWPLLDFEFDLDHFQFTPFADLAWTMGETMAHPDPWAPTVTWSGAVPDFEFHLWDQAAVPTPFGPRGLPSPNLPEPRAGGQDSPGDSLYKAAREILNRGDYRRAADLLRTFEQRYPRSRYLPAAMYWQAFALYRVGADTDLRSAYGILERQRERYPDAARENEVAALYTRVAGALAARGDAQAAAAIRSGVAQAALSCDKEEESVRAEALSALVQADPAAGRDILRRILARRDECSAGLRRRAVYLLARDDTPGVTAELLSVARTDPDPQVRTEAISHLGRRDGDDATRALVELFTTDLDERTQRSILDALGRRDTEVAHQFIRRVIEREDVNESVRAAAVRSLFSRRWAPVTVVSPGGGTTRVTTAGARTQALSQADAEYLRSLYGRTSSRTLKTTVLDMLIRAGDQASDAWLLQLIRNPNEDRRYRTAAVRNLRRTDVPVSELGSLYEALAERELRSAIISVLGQREEDAATDKLIEIARQGTDPYLRRQAISALARKKDPRTTKLLLELVEP